MISDPLIGIMFTYNFAFQGMGKPIPTLILSTGRQGLIFLPMLIIMSKLKGFDGIIFAQPTADLVCIVLAFVMFNIVINKIKKQEQTPNTEEN